MCRPTPLQVMTAASCFTWDAESAAAGFEKHPASTEEIRACLDDLKVRTFEGGGGMGLVTPNARHDPFRPLPQLLGKKEFKSLLKWRLALRQSFPEALRPLRDTPGGTDAGGDDDDNEIDEEEGSEDGEEEEEEEEAELRELSAEAAAELRRRKREGKRDAKRKAKSQQRQRLGMNLRNVDLLDTELNLFSLTGIRKLAGAAGRGGGADAALESVINVNLDDDGALGGVELALLAADVRARGGEERSSRCWPCRRRGRGGEGTSVRWEGEGRSVLTPRLISSSPPSLPPSLRRARRLKTRRTTAASAAGGRPPPQTRRRALTARPQPPSSSARAARSTRSARAMPRCAWTTSTPSLTRPTPSSSPSGRSATTSSASESRRERTPRTASASAAAASWSSRRC